MEFKEDKLRFSVGHNWGSDNSIEKIVILGLKKEPLHIHTESSCTNRKCRILYQ